jgi:DNA-binding NarL/FixJ family response regulator
MHSDVSYVIECLKAGGRAYVLSDALEQDMAESIRLVTAGSSFFSEAVGRLLAEDCLRRIHENSGAEFLSPLEEHILQLLADGKGIREAARLLRIGSRAVETKRFNTMLRIYRFSAARSHGGCTPCSLRELLPGHRTALPEDRTRLD